MYYIVLMKPPEIPDALVDILAQATGLSRYDARMRIPRATPGVLLHTPNEDEVRAWHATLANARFEMLLLGDDDIERDAQRVLVREFELGAQALQVWTEAQEAHSLAWSQISLLLVGRGIETVTTSSTTTQRKFSLGLSLATGGLVNRRSVSARKSSTSQEEEGFIHVYARETTAPPLVFRETRVRYQGLGDAMLMSRAANFRRVLAELRQRCPHAPVDERLHTRAGKTQILGSQLSPEDFLDVAITLVVRDASPR